MSHDLLVPNCTLQSVRYDHYNILEQRTNVIFRNFIYMKIIPLINSAECGHVTLPFTELDKVALALVEWMCPDLLSIQAQQSHVTVVSRQK